MIQKISITLKNPETQRILEELSALAESNMRQLSEASKYIQERLPPVPLPMRVLDHIVEIITVIDEPLSLDGIFHYLLARDYQPKRTTDSSKQYVLSLLKKHAIFSGSSWHLTETRSQEMPALVANSSDWGDA
jgi:hypothetical protein